MNASLVALAMLLLTDFDNLELASLNNAITGFGKADPSNHGYDKAVELGLIQPDGTPLNRESLEEAMSREINKRVEEGRFQ